MEVMVVVMIVVALAAFFAGDLASLIPVYGWIAAAALGVAAGIAFLAADFILGKLSVAEEELAAAEKEATAARNAEAEARTLLVSRCPEQAATCLLRPSPCPGNR